MTKEEWEVDQARIWQETYGTTKGLNREDWVMREDQGHILVLYKGRCRIVISPDGGVAIDEEGHGNAYLDKTLAL